jgi:hypothetical protein
VPYEFDGSQLGVSKLTGMGISGGITFFVWGQLYTGVDGAMEWGSIDSPTIKTPHVTLSNSSGLDVFLFQGGVPIGYRIPLGRASLRGEVVLGAISVEVTHDIKSDIPGGPSSAVATAWRGLVEPRLAADIWFTQHVSFSAAAGTNALDVGGRSLALLLTWHNRAFDGDMSLW